MAKTHILALIIACAATPSLAEAPNVKTPSPVIFLADNLDEEAGLGWCIDTVGRGFNDQLHAHSCKPQGGDVQFAYDTANNAIASATFDGKCMTLQTPSAGNRTFGLVDCDTSDPAQRFTYDAGAQTIQLGSDPSQCVTVEAGINPAGPFQSRTLIHQTCTELDDTFKQWVVRP